MRKTILIGFGITVALGVGFFAGRWSMRSSTGGPGANDGETPETTAVPETLRPVHDPYLDQTRARVKYLIEMLVSKNPAPKITGELDERDAIIEYSKEYNDSLQVPVYLALQQLLAEGEGAFDQLLAHTDDNRYSFTVKWTEQFYNRSVSDVCKSIVERNLRCCNPELHLITRGGPDPYPNLEPFGGSLAKWWQKNKKRGLAALQIESIDDTIAFMRHLDGRTAVPWHPEAERRPINEFNRLRDENVRILKAIRQYIVQTGKPYRPKILDGWPSEIIALPWTGRQMNEWIGK
ncbi:MAG: hypothetical protein HYS12_07130 [Planctomycetes bacterium]|nr:hypothetical protein [Planctomycetota bacterium]